MPVSGAEKASRNPRIQRSNASIWAAWAWQGFSNHGYGYFYSSMLLSGTVAANPVRHTSDSEFALSQDEDSSLLNIEYRILKLLKTRSFLYSENET
jgi:hypothetical protein